MNTRQLILTAAAVCSAGIFLGAAELSADAKAMIRKTDLTRQENEFRGDYLVREGHRLFEEGNFLGARDKYLEAIKLFRLYPSKFFQDKVEFCQKEIAACYYAMANEAADKSDTMARASDFDEAIKICKEAIRYCPEQAEELLKRVALYEKRRDLINKRDEYTASKLVPNKEGQDYQIQILLEQARRLAALKDYSSALLKYNEILLLDPFNADATQGRRGIARRISKMANQRYVNTHRRIMAEIEWKYALPIVNEASGSAANLIAESLPKEETVKESPIKRKLDEIRIPKLDHPNKAISSIVNTLLADSRKYDSEGKGVNIIYIRDVRNADETPEERQKREELRKQREEKRKQEAAKNKQDSESSEEEESGSNNSEESEDSGDGKVAVDPDEPKVTLQADSPRTLYQALMMLCQTARPKLNMQIDDHAVVLTPADVTLSNMILRSYAVTIPSSWEADNAEDISKRIQEALNAQSDGRNLFPKGSYIYYNSSTKRVSITNSADNHQEIARLLEKSFAPKDSTMVQVMVKLVDINQNDLDELAFNWQLAVNSSKERQNSDGKLTRSFITEPNNPLLRYYNPAGEHPAGDVSGSLLSWVWQNEKGTRVVASMFAMNQADSSDVLMSPRITVKAGSVAIVKMVENRYFPDDWDDIDGEQTEGIRIDPTLQPVLDEETPLGVDFSVQPSVTGDVIDAQINVNFTTFAGWSEYDTRVFDEDGSVKSGEYQRFAILNTPKLNTKIVARDGETIIAGGIVADQTSSINDKIPILGDIPFIGRLFKSKGSKTVKRNMLVFVTFRLVKPDGTPAHPRYQKDGLFSQGYPRLGSGL